MVVVSRCVGALALFLSACSADNAGLQTVCCLSPERAAAHTPEAAQRAAGGQLLHHRPQTDTGDEFGRRRLFQSNQRLGCLLAVGPIWA